MTACDCVDLVIIHTEWDEFKALDFKKLSTRKKFKIYDYEKSLFTTKYEKTRVFISFTW